MSRSALSQEEGKAPCARDLRRPEPRMLRRHVRHIAGSATAAALATLMVACGQGAGPSSGPAVMAASVADEIDSCAAVLAAGGQAQFAANARAVVRGFREQYGAPNVAGPSAGDGASRAAGFPRGLTETWVLFGCAAKMLQIGKRPQAEHARAVATAYCEQRQVTSGAISSMGEAAMLACDPWPSAGSEDVDHAVIEVVDSCASVYASDGQTNRAAAMTAAATKLREAEAARRRAQEAALQGRPHDTGILLDFAPDQLVAECAIAMRQLDKPVEAERAERVAMAKCVQQVRAITMQSLRVPDPTVSCPR